MRNTPEGRTVGHPDFGMKAYVREVRDDVHVTINFEGIRQ